MKASLHGHINGSPAVAVVGTWDPLLPMHQELFRHLSDYGRRISRASLVIMLHPPPPSFIPESPLEWPVYDDPKTRISLIKACGINATLLVHFQKQDLDAPLKDFFELIRPHARLDELWLGAHQTLGRGPDASNEALSKLAKRQKTLLQRLPLMGQPQVVQQARDLLRQGRLARLISLVGRPPVWSRPVRRKFRLSWPPGSYLCFRTDGPDTAPKGSPIIVQFTGERGGLSSTDWPNKRIKWLAFTAGPADRS
ncbi:MAG: hypothetical protein ACREBG_01270 [Pyrinomonadaceae bacterium]